VVAVAVVLLNFIKHRVSCAQSLYKAERAERKLFGFDPFHKLPTSQGQQHVRVHLIDVSGGLHLFQGDLKLVDAFEALDN